MYLFMVISFIAEGISNYKKTLPMFSYYNTKIHKASRKS